MFTETGLLIKPKNETFSDFLFAISSILLPLHHYESFGLTVLKVLMCLFGVQKE